MSNTQGRTFGLQWHITDNCDQRCRHCYVFNSSGACNHRELSLSECVSVLDKYLDFCKNVNCKPGIVITGGDPLLASFFWEFVARMKENGLSYTILGNPFHITTEVAKKLLDSGCNSYQLSLDGMQTTHDYFRKQGSFLCTLRAIKILKEAGISTKIMSTISKVNYKEIPEIVKVCIDLKVDVFAFARYAPTHGDIEDLMKPMEYREFLETMWDLYCKEAHKGTTFSLKDHLWKLFLYEKGILQPNNESLIIDGCNCAIRHMNLLPNGDVYACRRFESPVGNILNSSFREIFFGRKMEKFREYEKFEACSKCELLHYCRGCPAVAYGANGNFYAKDPQCWK